MSVDFSADLGEKDDGNTSRQKEKDAGNNLPDSAVFTAAATPSPANSLSAIPNINDKDVDLSSDSEEAEVEHLVGSNDRPLSESFH